MGDERARVFLGDQVHAAHVVRRGHRAFDRDDHLHGVAVLGEERRIDLHAPGARRRALEHVP